MAGHDPQAVLRATTVVRDFMLASALVDLEEQQEILRAQAQMARAGGGIRLGR